MVRSDEDLLLAARDGDGDALAAFYRRHAAAVTGFHRRRVGLPEVAFDLTAETFASLVAALDRFDPARGSARGWLFTIGRRARWSRGVLPAVAAIAVLGTGTAAATVVLGPDDQPENQVTQALFAGHRAAEASPDCRPAMPRALRLVDDPVPPGLLAQLGVLRRSEATRDRNARAEQKLGGGEVLARSVRVARADDGWSYRLSLARGSQSPFADPLRCAQTRRDASIAAAADFDAEVRTRVTKVVDGELAYAAELYSGQTFTLQFDELRPDGRQASGGATIIHDDTIPAVASSMGSFRGRYVSLSGLVLDGVATVRVIDRSGSPRARAVTIPVNDNVYHALMPRRMGPRMLVEWRAPDGSVVRRTHARY